MLAVDPHVYIPSKGRAHLVYKMASYWVNDFFNVTYVVEPQDAADYTRAIERLQGRFKDDGLAIDVKILPKDNQGISYSRHHCIILAASYGLDSMILSDDDFKPGRNSGLDSVVEFAKNPKVLGITAKYGYHDLCLGPSIRGRKDIVLMPVGSQAVVGLNIRNVMDLGNYDKSLDYAEDCDLFIRAIQAGYPWLIALGASVTSVGVRYAPGGMAEYAGDRLAEKKAEWHINIHDKWPEFTNEHTAKCAGKQNCIRMKWRKVYDVLMPNWREYSDLHGGSLKEYLDGH
jgi:hypothetical protein